MLVQRHCKSVLSRYSAIYHEMLLIFRFIYIHPFLVKFVQVEIIPLKLFKRHFSLRILKHQNTSIKIVCARYLPSGKSFPKFFHVKIITCTYIICRYSCRLHSVYSYIYNIFVSVEYSDRDFGR